ncbi:MAG: outer-membrane lipoprotein carrier protein LolA [Bacteroidetes bacterium]|nr:outer-membrane lipoprotein carrier protein LolA [Bacteroidota bacterium]
MKSKIFILGWVIAGMFMPLVAQNATIQAIQKKFNSLTDISASYQQYSGKTLVAKGTFSYKKENKVRLTFGNNLIVSDGKTNWNHDKKQNKVIVTKVDNKAVSLLSVNKLINNTPGDCDLSGSGNTVKMTPKKGKQLGFKSVEITKDGQDLISSITIEDNSKVLMKINFSGYSLNKGIPDSDFTFKPSGDIKVVDLR